MDEEQTPVQDEQDNDETVVDESTVDDHTGPDDDNDENTRKDGSDKKDDSSADDDEAEVAELLKMAENPRTRRAALLALAEKHNIGNGTRSRDESSSRFTQQTQQEERKAPKAPLQDRLKAKMGADYDLVPQSIWSAINEAFEDYFEPHRESFDKFAKGIGRQNAEAGMERFFDKYKPASKYEGKLAELSQRVSPRDNQTVESYMKDLWFQYCGDRGWNPQTGTPFGSSNKNERENRNNQNRREATQNRVSGGQRPGQNKQPLDRKAIIAAAIAQHSKSRT